MKGQKRSRQQCPTDHPSMLQTESCFPKTFGLVPAYQDGTDRWFSGLRWPARQIVGVASRGGRP